jgi:predicted O-methyltransferase YrrM
MYETLKQLRVGPENVIEIGNVGRGDLAVFMAKDAKRGAEIGVAYGYYSKTIMEANPELEMYGVDSYASYVGYKDYALKATLDKLEESAHSLLDQYPDYNFIKKYSMDAVKDFEDESLDFVYIDANHDDPWVTEDITEWTKKVRKGGIVSGHDYGRVRSIEDRYRVMQAVNRYAKENEIQLIIWGFNSKIDRTLVRDTIRSWSFIKP